MTYHPADTKTPGEWDAIAADYRQRNLLTLAAYAEKRAKAQRKKLSNRGTIR